MTARAGLVWLRLDDSDAAIYVTKAEMTRNWRSKAELLPPFTLSSAMFAGGMLQHSAVHPCYNIPPANIANIHPQPISEAVTPVDGPALLAIRRQTLHPHTSCGCNIQYVVAGGMLVDIPPATSKGRI